MFPSVNTARMLYCLLALVFAETARGDYWRGQFPGSGVGRGTCEKRSGTIDDFLRSAAAIDSSCRVDETPARLTIGFILRCSTGTVAAFRRQQDCERYKAEGENFRRQELAPAGTKNWLEWVVALEQCLPAAVHPNVITGGAVQNLSDACQCYADWAGQFGEQTEKFADKTAWTGKMKACFNGQGLDLADSALEQAFEAEKALAVKWSTPVPVGAAKAPGGTLTKGATKFKGTGIPAGATYAEVMDALGSYTPTSRNMDGTRIDVTYKDRALLDQPSAGGTCRLTFLNAEGTNESRLASCSGCNRKQIPCRPAAK